MKTEVKGFQPEMLGAICLALWLGKNFTVTRSVQSNSIQLVGKWCAKGAAQARYAWAVRNGNGLGKTLEDSKRAALSICRGISHKAVLGKW